MANKTIKIPVTIGGVTKSLTDWCRDFSVGYPKMKALLISKGSGYRLTKRDFERVGRQWERKPIIGREIALIPGYPRYVATSEGHIYNIKTGRRLSEHLVPTKYTKYLSVSLSKNGVVVRYRVHRLCMIALRGYDPDPARCEVDHKDNNSLNNRIENLQWLTPLENTQKAMHNLPLKGRSFRNQQ